MVGRKRTRVAEEATRTLTVHQIVAYNFARARNTVGWTQVETSQHLEPFLGYKLNQAGISAIEKTYDSERRRNIDTAEVVAFARCFGVPIGWFFLPPPEHAGDLVEPLHADDRYHIPAAELVALTIGSSSGWRVYLDRVRELLATDRAAIADALHNALDGQPNRDDIETQLDLRRRAIRDINLARHASPADDVITNMAELLLRLVRLTPGGMDRLRQSDPRAALLLLEEGDKYLDTHLLADDNRKEAGRASRGGFDDIRPVELAAALGLADPREDS